MEKFQELKGLAEKKLIVADHMLTQTYNVVHEPKMLYFVLENVFLSMSNNMTAILEYEKLFKRVPQFADNFESKLNLFELKSLPKYQLNEKYADVMRQLKEMIVLHKESPVEFSRKDRFVMCDDEFKCKALSVEEIKKYIGLARQFMKDSEKIFTDEKLFEGKK